MTCISGHRALRRNTGARWLLGAALVLPLLGCTTIGHHEIAPLTFGPPVELRLCGLLDEGISHPEALELLTAAWGEEGARYGITLRLSGVRPWARPGFTAEAIMAALYREPRPANCEFLLAFIGRHAGDALWALGLPEVLGAAEFKGTRAFVVARRASLNQLVQPPAAVLRHELYHLLGCEHGLWMGPCYRAIVAAKKRAR